MAIVPIENEGPGKAIEWSVEILSGAPGQIRTGDPLLRRQTLYPTELRAHAWELIQFKAIVESIATGTARKRRAS